MQYIISFLEGIITIISPCLLPMIPIYLSYFAGGGERSKKKTLTGALGFVSGFTLVFVILGAFAGTLGSLLREYQTVVNIISGIVVILLGLNFLGVLNLNIWGHTSNRAIKKDMDFFASVFFGIVFSLGWTPCIGAFLGSALMLVAQQGQVVKGIIMLFLYSAGLGIPFIISALLIDQLKSTFDFIKRNYGIINVISGLFLVLIGILMATGILGSFLSILS